MLPLDPCSHIRGITGFALIAPYNARNDSQASFTASALDHPEPPLMARCVMRVGGSPPRRRSRSAATWCSGAASTRSCRSRAMRDYREQRPNLLQLNTRLVFTLYATLLFPLTKVKILGHYRLRCLAHGLSEMILDLLFMDTNCMAQQTRSPILFHPWICLRVAPRKAALPSHCLSLSAKISVHDQTILGLRQAMGHPPTRRLTAAGARADTGD